MGSKLSRRDVPADIEREGTWLSQSEENHLRRLVAWVRCEIGQSPDELIAMVQDLAKRGLEFDDFAKNAMVNAHKESASIPQYVRAAVKALEKMIYTKEANRGK